MSAFRVVKVDISTAVRVGLIVGAIVGCAIDIVYIIAAVTIGIIFDGYKGGIENLVIGFFTGTFLGLVYIVLSGLFTLMYSILYNYASKHWCSLRLELQQIKEV